MWLDSQESWIENSQLIHYDPTYTHPNWLSAQPTADLDIFWFLLKPQSDWQFFSFAYPGVKTSVRYRKQDRHLQMSIYMPAEILDGEYEKEDLLYRCLIYLGNASIYQDLSVPPRFEYKYNIIASFEEEIELKWPSDQIYFGFYTSTWY